MRKELLNVPELLLVGLGGLGRLNRWGRLHRLREGRLRLGFLVLGEGTQCGDHLSLASTLLRLGLRLEEVQGLARFLYGTSH